MLLKLLLTLLFLLCVQLAGAAKMSAPMNLLFSEFWTWRLSR
jgi:hypothetical protein